ncbi:serine hydrolase [Amycolatopsis albispora]|uniref:Serine hydrolase n=2 Tax=Amycolatopsis albispora TaxID=1804986 RepID=A0A344LK65_9PSEU|nr:serine hydrolase [Amycolatopsis albispora]
MADYLARQVKDRSHREVLGPLLPASGASGVILHKGQEIAAWGAPSTPEMAYSVTKSFVSAVAGIAYDRGLLPDVDRSVAATVDLSALGIRVQPAITWRHLLQQTSQWDGELWGKPARVDAASAHRAHAPPGGAWAYNDVRVNLLSLALTVLFQQPLPTVLHENLLEPLGASPTWSWHGYRNSTIELNGKAVPVVSGGAHWGGGLWISARDLARFGQLYLDHGRHRGKQLLSSAWIEHTWRPCPVNPDYGYLWWLNDAQRVFPTAPPTGRCARGNADRHLLWIDPARDLVIASRCGENVEILLHAVSAALPGSRG